MGLVARKQLDTASLTLQQLQKDYKRTVSTLTANCSLLEEQQLQCARLQMDSSAPSSSSSGDDAAAAAAAFFSIQGALQEYWAQLNMLLKGSRGPLIHAFFITNLDTGKHAARAVHVADCACRFQLYSCLQFCYCC
jgi:hypothetical protein